MTNDHIHHDKKASPPEGPSDEVITENLEQNKTYSPHLMPKKESNLLFYSTIGLVFLFVLVMTGVNTGSLGLFIIRFIEWTTLYILPWIFLYYFIQFVRTYIKGRQG